MSDELIDKIVNEVGTWKKAFYFSPFKVNEPLLDKRTIPVCERVNEIAPEAVIRIFTNGAALTPEKIEGIANLKRVAHLWISLNSHLPDEYEEIMGMRFEQTVKRIDYLHTQDFPHQVVLSTVGRPNDEFEEYCRERWPKFQTVVIKRDGWLGYVNPESDEIPDGPCSRWFELSIMADGRVAHCCMDGKGDYCIGDVNKNTLLEIYNAPFWRERREKLLSRKALDERSPCSRCTY